LERAASSKVQRTYRVAEVAGDVSKQRFNGRGGAPVRVLGVRHLSTHGREQVEVRSYIGPGQGDGIKADNDFGDQPQIFG
jgi:hypothetical protein